MIPDPFEARRVAAFIAVQTDVDDAIMCILSTGVVDDDQVKEWLAKRVDRAWDAWQDLLSRPEPDEA